MVTEIIKKLDNYAYSCQKWAYKRYSHKSQPMYFMMKCKKIFDKYMIVWENVSNIIKKINGQLLYNRKYLKTEKKIHKR